jgi:Rrf2 family transcriptional regulator, iron-sulfur cluster assembly transcription factor
MFYSSASKYAVLAATFMASEPEKKIFTVDEIAKGAKVPRPYLSKILKQLVAGKLLKSSKGPGGGYQFAKPISEINLYDIKISVDGISEFVDCALGLDTCNDSAPCPAHFVWKELRANSKKAMQITDLPEAVRVMQEKSQHRDTSKRTTFRKIKDN